MLRVEIDDNPRSIFGESADWLSMLVARQLVGALFVEQRDGSVGTGILRAPVRTGDMTWRFDVDNSSRWNDGSRITASDIRDNFARISAVPSSLRFLFAYLSSISSMGRGQLEIETRFPIAELPALLASPYFGVRPDPSGRTAGAYTLIDHAPGHLLLSANRDHPDLLLRVTDSSAEGLTLFRSGDLDITSATTLDPSVWANLAEHRDAQVDEIRIALHLIPPASFDVAAMSRLDAALDRDRIAAATNNAIVPLVSDINMWEPMPVARTRQRRGPRVASDPVPLHFTRYTPNPVVAQAISEQFTASGITVRPQPADYGEYLSGRAFTEGFQLVLTYAAWPHPAAALYRAILGGDHGADGSRGLALAALAAEDRADCLRIAGRCADRRRESTGEIVIGRLKSGVLHRAITFDPPPSGWIDYSTCAPDSIIER